MTVNQQAERPDPRTLLEAFATSSRNERAFTVLVTCLSGLVYSSALRRTGNAQLAEEVTQNVFAIMARKAPSLRRHPSLEAWALETARLEAASAMRAEGRRLRKIAALAAQTSTVTPPSSDSMNSSIWEDALPALNEALDSLPMRDRDIVLQRFYVGKKFQEIADTSRMSEAACKMRLKRALEKLSRFLTARGTSLTAAAVASLLATDFARATPAQSAATLASRALTASSSLSPVTLLINTFQTMNTAKSSTLTAAAVLALAAFPLSIQYAEGSRLESQLADRPITAAAAVKPVAAVRTSNQSDSRNVEEMIANLSQKSDNVSIIRSLLTSGYTDTLREQLILSRIGQMPSEQRAQFMADLERFPCNEFRKKGIVASIAKLSPAVSPRENLERMIQLGQTSQGFDNYMRDWAKADPAAALQWYQETKAAGKFYPGLDNEFQKDTTCQFIDGAVKTNPQLALDFYQSTPRDEMGEEALRVLARGVADAVVKSGDPAMVLTLLDSNSTPEDRQDILAGMLYSHVNVQKYEEGAAFVEAHEPDEERRYKVMQQVLQTVEPDKIEGALTWMLGKTYEKEGVQVVRRLVEALNNRAYDYPAWFRRQAPDVQQQLPKLDGFNWDEK